MGSCLSYLALAEVYNLFTEAKSDSVVTYIETETPTQSTNGAKYSIFGMANPLLVFYPLCPKGFDDVHNYGRISVDI